MSDEEEKVARGRKSGYSIEIGRKICDAMAEGYTLAAAAALIPVGRTTVHRWKEEHEDFANLIDIGHVKRQHFFETEMIKLVQGKTRTQAAALIFTLKNLQGHDWRDRVEVTGEDGQKLQIEHVIRTIVDPLLDQTQTIELEANEEDDNAGYPDATSVRTLT